MARKYAQCFMCYKLMKNTKISNRTLRQCPECKQRVRWKYSIKAKYNLTEGDYLQLLKKQGGVCATCKNKCTKRLVVDHCHLTNKVRGLLCHKCNVSLGLVTDNTSVLKAMITYLEEHV